MNPPLLMQQKLKPVLTTFCIFFFKNGTSLFFLILQFLFNTFYYGTIPILMTMYYRQSRVPTFMATPVLMLD